MIGYIKYFIAISVLIMLCYSLYSLYNKKWKFFDDKLITMLVILFIACFTSISQHFILNSRFLTDRMALFFIPLFFITLLIFLNDLNDNKYFKKISIFILLIISLTSFVHFINASNTSYYYNWQINADIKQMLNDLDKQRLIDGKTSVKLGLDGLFWQSITFYKKTKKYEWLEELQRTNKKSGNLDYYYLFEDNIFKNDPGKIKEYPLSFTILLKQ
jgi:hypothetical protein